MSAHGACAKFEKHAWKRDACAGCQRPRAEHVVQPAKRLSKTSDDSPPDVPTSESSGESTDKTKKAITEQSNAVNNDGVKSPRKVNSANKGLRSSNDLPTANVKPVPLKAKPRITDKPEIVAVLASGDSCQKTGVTSETQSHTSTADHTREPLRQPLKPHRDPRSRPLSVPPAVPKPSENGIALSDGIVFNEVISETNETSDIASKIKTADNSQLDANNGLATGQKMLVPGKGKSSGSHYYQVYDVTAKGLSGSPEPLADGIMESGAGQAASVERDTQSDTLTRSCRIVDVAEEHVAMPYTVVDVTVSTLTRQKEDKPPPRLPSTPAPVTSSTLPRNPSAKSSDAVSSRAQSVSLVKLESGAAQDPVPSLHKVEDDPAIELEDFQDDWPRYTPRGVYEDIPEEEITANRAMAAAELNHNSPARLSAGKSSEFDAKMAALSGFDFGQGVKLSAPVAAKRETKLDDVAALTAGGQTMKSSTVEIKDMPLGKSEKGRKSGRKTFLQKLLKIGGTDAGVAISKPPPVTLSDGAASPTENSNPTPDKSEGETPSPEKPLVLAQPLSSMGGVPSSISPQQRESQAVAQEMKGRLAQRLQTSPAPGASSAPDGNNEETPKLVLIDLPVSSPSKSPVVPIKSPSKSPAVRASLIEKEAGIGFKPGPVAAAKPAPRSSVSSSPKPCPQSPKPSAVPSLRISQSRASLGSPPSLLAAVITGNSPSTGGNSPSANLASGCEASADGDEPGKELVARVDSQTSSRLVLIDLKTASERCCETPQQQQPVAAARLSCSISPSTYSVEKLLPEQKPVRAPRKMSSAPPPPPPDVRLNGPPVTATTDLSRSAVATESRAESTDAATRWCDVSSRSHDDSKSNEDLEDCRATDRANTLPRNSSSLPRDNMTQSISGLNLRPFASPVKLGRGQTSSTEGMQSEGQGLLSEACGEFSDDRIFELSERRKSKFLHRALPAPPSDPPPNSGMAEGQVSQSVEPVCHPVDDIDNLYELVSQTDTLRSTYEDIDDSSNSTDDRISSTSSASRKSPSRTAIEPAALDYYLEPVSRAEDRDPALQNGVGRPRPAPRGGAMALKSAAVSKTETFTDHRTAQETSAELAGSSYVNTKRGRQLSASIAECFGVVASLNHDMLRHLGDRLYAKYVQRVEGGGEGVWEEFKVRTDSAVVLGGEEGCMVYRATHSGIAPNGCFVMVSPVRPAANLSSDHCHANLLWPLRTFPVTSETLPSVPSLSDPPESTGRTAYVLLCDSVLSLDEYWSAQHGLVSCPPGGVNLVSCSAAGVPVERLVCYSLSRVLSAALYLRASGCPVERLRVEDVLYVRCGGSFAWFTGLRSSVVAEICLDRHAGAVCDDAAALLHVMLKADPSATIKDRMAAATPRAAFCRALQRAARLFGARTWQSLDVARNLLEFVLWGPPEGEARIAAMEERSREAAFRTWLDVARCRALARLVLEPDGCDGEVADQVAYLCRVSESTLIEVTTHLFL